MALKMIFSLLLCQTFSFSFIARKNKVQIQVQRNLNLNCIISINPYWQHFGTITECHFRKQNPENFFLVTILVTSYIEHLKSSYHISKQQGVFYLYQKYFKHVTSSSAEICLGFCFRKWRSVKNPIFGFCFRDLPIWVNPYWQISGSFLRPFYWKTHPSKNHEYLFSF